MPRRLSRLTRPRRAGHAHSVIGLLAGQLRSGEVSSRDLVERSLRLIEAGDGDLGAVVALRAEQARAEAVEVDRARAAGNPVGRLAGLPVLVKDLEDVAGMTTTRGSLLHADDPPAARDGLVPGRLRAAGGIVVGKTTTNEFAIGHPDPAKPFPIPRNPWNPAFSPGGSSAGTGAGVPAGMFLGGLGTDTGGSVRMPAAFCGISGIKATFGQHFSPVHIAAGNVKLICHLIHGLYIGAAKRDNFRPCLHKARQMAQLSDAPGSNNADAKRASRRLLIVYSHITICW